MNIFKRILIAILEPWTSKKLWMTLIAIIIMQQLFWLATWYLYSFPEEWRAKFFVEMFFVTQGTIATIVLGFLGFSRTTIGAGIMTSLLTRKEPSKTETEE